MRHTLFQASVFVYFFLMHRATSVNMCTVHIPRYYDFTMITCKLVFAVMFRVSVGILEVPKLVCEYEISVFFYFNYSIIVF